MTGVAWWSQTAANNANQDPTINWAEGQAPSSVNDSARALMAGTAKYRDDIAGAIVTAGTSTAYTVTSNQAFDSLTRLAGQVIAFSPHTANTGACTLNVDGLGAKLLRSAPGVDLPAGTLLQGTPYVALYNNTAGEFYLQGFIGNPYSVPVGGMLLFGGTVAPNSSFAFCNGSQLLSRSVYSTLFSILGTAYGAGNGSTTFGIPDFRGRVPAGADPGGLNLTGATMNFLTNGGTGGSETRSLATANLPPYTPAGSVTAVSGTSTGQFTSFAGNVNVPGGSNPIPIPNGSNSNVTFSGGTGTFTGTAQGGSSQAFGIVQPTLLCSIIMRII
ncbi:microcystin-dependent protein [Bradyrhizobium sp. USDA 4461]